ncbi:MAG TPA: ATP-grasp domain-containing protein [Pseudonocardiaceae bacterium]
MPLLTTTGQVLPLDTQDAQALRRLRPDAVLTFSERQVRRTAALAEDLGLPGHTRRNAELVTDKYQQRRELNGAGVDATRTALIQTPDDWIAAHADVGLPAVLKPTVGEGSRDTFLIDEPKTGATLVRRALTRDGVPRVLEQYLTGRDSDGYGSFVSVESAIAHGDAIHLAITGKFTQLPPFRERGNIWPARLTEDEAQRVLDLAGRAIRALGLCTGLTHTEVKLTPDGPRVIEVNGRLGGHLNDLAITSAGINLIELAGRVALGESVHVPLIRPDTVHFHYVSPSLTRRCRFVRARGTSIVRQAPGITGYRLLIPPGTELEESVMTRPVDIIQGVADDHTTMLNVIDAAMADLTHVYVVDGETQFVPAISPSTATVAALGDRAGRQW